MSLPSYTLTAGEKILAVDLSKGEKATFRYYPEDGSLEQQILEALPSFNFLFPLKPTAYYYCYRRSKRRLTAAVRNREDERGSPCADTVFTLPTIPTAAPPVLKQLSDLRDGDRVRVVFGDYNGYLIYRARKGTLQKQAALHLEGNTSPQEEGEKWEWDTSQVELRPDGVTVVARKQAPQRVRVVLRNLKTHFAFFPQHGTVEDQAARHLSKVLGRPLAAHWTAVVTTGGKWGKGVTVDVQERPGYKEVNHLRAPPKQGAVVMVQVNQKGRVTARAAFQHRGGGGGGRKLDEEARAALKRERVEVPKGAVLRVVDFQDFGGRLLLSYDVGVEESWWKRLWRKDPGLVLAGVIAAGVLGKAGRDLAMQKARTALSGVNMSVDESLEMFRNMEPGEFTYRLDNISGQYQRAWQTLQAALQSGMKRYQKKEFDAFLLSQRGYIEAWYENKSFELKSIAKDIYPEVLLVLDKISPLRDPRFQMENDFFKTKLELNAELFLAEHLKTSWLRIHQILTHLAKMVPEIRKERRWDMSWTEFRNRFSEYSEEIRPTIVEWANRSKQGCGFVDEKTIWDLLYDLQIIKQKRQCQPGELSPSPE